MNIGEIVKSITAAQWVTIIVAFVSPIIALIGVVYTNHTTKKMTQKNIDANLIAKARIEWIQNVRNTTAGLISTYYLMLNESDPNESLKLYINAQEKLELLILYFGPEKDKEKPIKTTPNIFDEKTNDGKNDLIVRYLISLSSDFREHYKSIQQNIENNLNKKLENASQRMSENITGIEYQEDVKIDGQTYTNTEYSYEAEAEKQYNNILYSLHHMKKIQSIYEEKLMNLRTIIRIYLKLEWSKAKKGQ